MATKIVRMKLTRKTFMTRPRTAKSVRVNRFDVASRRLVKVGFAMKVLMGSAVMDILEWSKMEGEYQYAIGCVGTMECLSEKGGKRLRRRGRFV